ncbi:MAG: hypothetical protein EXR31_05115, partial [Betaproteobacteria bacterium]|nr:hypothetical protein [Betaproteobacteria bacterium]
MRSIIGWRRRRETRRPPVRRRGARSTGARSGGRPLRRRPPRRPPQVPPPSASTTSVRRIIAKHVCRPLSAGPLPHGESRMHPRLKGIAGAFLVALFAGLANLAAAQEYPNKVVRLVIPFPPGGSSEVQARILAQSLSDDWKQPVVIEYKPGAGSTVGAAYIAKSPPDGYTLYQVATSHAISASLYRNLPYDAITSFTPISLLSVSPLILSVHPRVKAATMKELIDLAK